jgi:hypothetical protein
MKIIAVAAKVGIYGNSKQEALYPLYQVDADKQPLDAAKYRDALRFAPGQLPPANAFWYVMVYELPLLPNMKHDANGGLTIYIQYESPGKVKESNWLPAPKGPFFMAMRLY